MTKYVYLDSSINKRSFADETNRQTVLTVTAKTATAGTKEKNIDILRANVNLIKARRLQPVGCEDSCPILVTNTANISVSGAYADQAELELHLNEAVRCTLKAWTDYGLKNGFLPIITADFAPGA